MADIPLDKVPNWSKEQVARLKDLWITTAEQVVALGATRDGAQALAEHLAISDSEMRRLIDSARATLAPDVQTAMEKRVDTSEYGLGALPE